MIYNKELGDLLHIDEKHNRVIYQRYGRPGGGYYEPYVFSLEQWKHYNKHGFSKCNCDG